MSKLTTITLKQKELKIDDEFRDLIPKLTSEEYEQLETSIRDDNCRDSIITWNDTIVDGHNRYDICKKNNIGFGTVSKDFKNRDEVKLWIIDNQFGRRNLSRYDRSVLALKKKHIIAADAKNNQGARTDISQKSVKSIDTQKQLAKDAGVSHDTIYKVEVIEKFASDEQKEKIRNQASSINKVFKDITAQQKKENFKRENAKLAEQYGKDPSITIIHGDFNEVCKNFEEESVDAIITDPPYPKQYIHVWEQLGETAGRLLKPSGFLVTYSGHMYLDRVIHELGRHLDYYWIISLLHSGPTQLVNPRNIVAEFKPVLIYQKPPCKKLEGPPLGDVIAKCKRDKDFHKWGQGELGVEILMNHFSKPNDLVLDPFVGGGTTLLVAKRLKRRAIGIDIDEECIATTKSRLVKNNYEKEEKCKPVIMEKLRIKEEDLEKSEVKEDRATQEGFPHTMNEFAKTIADMLAENNKTQKDIASVRIPLKPDPSKDAIEIEWVNDDEKPDPSGPTGTPELSRADDYDKPETNSGDFNTYGNKEVAGPPVQDKNTPLLPERCSPQIPQLNTIILGDCLKKLKKLPDDSADLIATDPPYGLKFMGKNWDKAVPTVEVWKEALRVLKPGAFAFVMSIPRQDCQSRMISNLEEAGFKVGFSPIYWTYAQGFPKASNISKAIDKRCAAERIKVRRNPNSRENCDKTNTIYESGTVGKTAYLTRPATAEAKRFEGSYGGFQPKPAVEVILVAMKPMDEKTYFGQAFKNGKGITWLDDCRIPYADNADKNEYAFNMDGNQRTRKESGEKLRLFDGGWKVDKSKKDIPRGRFPANLLISDDILDDGNHANGNGEIVMRQAGTGAGLIAQYDGRKTMPKIKEGLQTIRCIKDSGGYSRFFSQDAWAERNLPFIIVPKASKREKNAGLEGRHERVVGDGRKKTIDNPFQRGKTPRKNTHPTVKPIKLMAYLITMGSREGEVVLDPFCGSGSTCVAAKMLNRKFIGIELDKGYHEIAEKRVNNVAMKKAA